MSNQRQGWVRLFGEELWHYFGADGRSLCGSRMIFTVPKNADQNDDGAANCAECLAIRQQERGR